MRISLPYRGNNRDHDRDSTGGIELRAMAVPVQAPATVTYVVVLDNAMRHERFHASDQGSTYTKGHSCSGQGFPSTCQPDQLGKCSK